MNTLKRIWNMFWYSGPSIAERIDIAKRLYAQDCEEITTKRGVHVSVWSRFRGGFPCYCETCENRSGDEFNTPGDGYTRRVWAEAGELHVTTPNDYDAVSAPIEIVELAIASWRARNGAK